MDQTVEKFWDGVAAREAILRDGRLRVYQVTWEPDGETTVGACAFEYRLRRPLEKSLRRDRLFRLETPPQFSLAAPFPTAEYALLETSPPRVKLYDGGCTLEANLDGNGVAYGALSDGLETILRACGHRVGLMCLSYWYSEVRDRLRFRGAYPGDNGSRILCFTLEDSKGASLFRLQVDPSKGWLPVKELMTQVAKAPDRDRVSECLEKSVLPQNGPTDYEVFAIESEVVEAQDFDGVFLPVKATTRHKSTGPVSAWIEYDLSFNGGDADEFAPSTILKDLGVSAMTVTNRVTGETIVLRRDGDRRPARLGPSDSNQSDQGGLAWWRVALAGLLAVIAVLVAIRAMVRSRRRS